MPRDVRGSSSDDEPRIPIAPILKHYGAKHVPEGSGWRNMFCPFHSNERTPAATVNLDLQVFVCHGCDMKGNAAQLIMKKEGQEGNPIGFRAANERAAELAGLGDSEVHVESRSRFSVSRKSRTDRGNRRYRGLGRRDRGSS